jgi:hypothetical protein
MDNKLLQHYQNWLQEYDNIEETNLIHQNIEEEEIQNELQPAENEQFIQFPIDSHLSVKVFENEQIEVYVKKSFHQRQKNFRLQDNLFHIKIKTKEFKKQPLLFDLLDVFEKVFEFILNHLKTFFNPNDINEVYLTLFQEPMINGLNSPGVRLGDDPKEVVQRILDMLFRFLLSDSNMNLELNDTFIVYIHILSIDHVNFKLKNPKPKVINRRKKYGSYKNTNNKFTWGIDIPNGFGDKEFSKVFENECFIISVILGHFQNEYHRTNKQDKRILYAQNINSKCKSKNNYAGRLLFKELQLLKSHLNLLNGPYNVETISELLSNHYKCQIFIFIGEGKSSSLKSIFPNLLNDALEPIFLYETEKDHVIFIRQINTFFLKNQKICIYCRRKYKSSRFLHRCDM